MEKPMIMLLYKERLRTYVDVPKFDVAYGVWGLMGVQPWLYRPKQVAKILLEPLHSFRHAEHCSHSQAISVAVALLNPGPRAHTSQQGSAYSMCAHIDEPLRKHLYLFVCSVFFRSTDLQ